MKLPGTRLLLVLTALCAAQCSRCNGAAPADSGAPADTAAPAADASDSAAATLTVTSTAFAPNGAIPARHATTGCGAGAMNLSPALSWSGAPTGTRSFALVMDDPDAPGGTFTHWIAWDISPGTTSLPEGVRPTDPALVQGTSGFETVGYGGPCPPPPTGEHRYVFHVYALSVAALTLAPTADVTALRTALEGRVLAQGELVGRYRQ